MSDIVLIISDIVFTISNRLFYEVRPNLNSDASNLNLVARSFYKMPCSFPDVVSRFFYNKNPRPKSLRTGIEFVLN